MENKLNVHLNYRMLQLKRNKYKTLSDDQLLTLYKEKELSSIIGEYYIRYGHLVFGVALKHLNNKMEAEDLTMIVFEKLPQQLIKHSIQNFKSWLYSVTKNECLMLLRKKNKTPLSLEKDIPFINELEEISLKESQLLLLERNIEDLKGDQKICIKLFYIEQKSYQQIAEMKQMNIKSVKSAIQNGKRNLKLKLEGKNEFK